MNEIIDHDDFISFIRDQKPVGYFKQVPISLFDEMERNVFNSRRIVKKTKPSIILPAQSKFYHFWMDQFNVDVD